MPNQPAEGQVHLTLYLPKELRDRIKTAAANQGESVSAATRWLWELYVTMDAEGLLLSAAVRRALEEYAREKL